MIIGTVSLAGNAAAFLSASCMRISRFSCAVTRKRLPHRRAVFLGLIEGGRDRLDARMAAALGEIFKSLSAFRQIGKLGGGKAKLLGKLDGLRTDFGGHTRECRFDRHAGFHADQQKIQRIGKGAHDRFLAARDLVGYEHVRQIEADKGAREGRTDLHDARPVEMGDDEQIEQRRHEHDERHHETEKHEGNEWSLSAITGARQLLARVGRFQNIRQLQLFHRLLHEGDGGGAQRRARFGQ